MPRFKAGLKNIPEMFPTTDMNINKDNKDVVFY